SAQPTNPQNGKMLGISGQISAIDSASNSFTLALPGLAASRALVVTSTGNTAYQDIGDFSALAVGSFINMDGAIQKDGSVQATRIALQDASAANVMIGPLLFSSNFQPSFYVFGRQQQGTDLSSTHMIGAFPFNYDTAVLQISGQLANLQNLPFVPSFNGQ